MKICWKSLARLKTQSP